MRRDKKLGIKIINNFFISYGTSEKLKIGIFRSFFSRNSVSFWCNMDILCHKKTKCYAKKGQKDQFC